jgi:hypothetical protein
VYHRPRRNGICNERCVSWGILFVTGQIEPLLRTLGATADDVAAVLQTAGVRARRFATSFDNPVNRYVNRTLDIGGRLEIPLGAANMVVIRDGTWLAVRLPDPIPDFLDRFHRGDYPALEIPCRRVRPCAARIEWRHLSHTPGRGRHE